MLLHAPRALLCRLLRQPGFTALTLGTLALGIGANVAIFTVVNGVLLEPLPYPDSHELVDLRHTVQGLDVEEAPQSVGSYTLYRRENRVFEDVGLYAGASWTLTADDGEPERLPVARVTESVFPVLGVAPARGQGIREEHVAPGGEDVAVLSHDLWRRRFGGDPDVLGRTIRLNSVPYLVTGVMPEGFAFPDEDAELWVPFDIAPEDLPRVSFSYLAVARLRSGVTPEEAETDLARILPGLPEAFPGDLTGAMIRVRARARRTLSGDPGRPRPPGREARGRPRRAARRPRDRVRPHPPLHRPRLRPVRRPRVGESAGVPVRVIERQIQQPPPDAPTGRVVRIEPAEALEPE